MRRVISLFILLLVWLPIASANSPVNVPILTYHNFDPSVPGSMTVSTTRFEEQMKWLKDNGYTVIPLMTLVDYLRGKHVTLPAKSVVITADDGRNTVYKYMLPVIRKYHYPVTLFIYPSPISRTSYALTWEQIKELQKTGLFDVQSHTYWHPNFNQEKKHLSPKAYQELVNTQLVTSKKILEEKLGTPITLLAWPYGVYDRYLEGEAAKAGYIMAFSVDDRSANLKEKTMAQPRYLVSQKLSMKQFEKMVSEGFD